MSTSYESVGGGGEVLHQALHGYMDGHRLLASSVAVPDEIGRLMLRLSDLSGTSVRSGFDQYITGYPLQSLGVYALAKSWYAPEMPRPGCVWTHTILIKTSMLARIATLGLLRPLFTRPKKELGYNAFKETIPFVENGITVREAVPLEEHGRILAKIIYAHYADDEFSILLPARDSSEFEAIIFGIWSQKWASARLEFTFCTGALSTRSNAGRPFDIQCAPIALTRDVFLEIAALGAAKPLIVDNTPVETLPWVETAAADIFTTADHLLRNFLWAVADETSTRVDFAQFVSLYDAISKSVSLGDVLALLVKLYPDKSSGIKLKTFLLGAPSEHKTSVSFDEAALLCLIGTFSEYEAINLEVLDLRGRGSRLCIARPDAGIVLIGDLLRGPLNPLGEEILVGAISEIELAGILTIAREQPQFITALVKVRPSLMAERALWVGAGQWTRELFECAVAQEKDDEAIIRAAVHSILQNGPESLFRRALERWGRLAVFSALDWASDASVTLSSYCRGALTFHIQEVADWAQASQEKNSVALVIAAHVLAPYSYQIRRHSTDVWCRVYRELCAGRQDSEKLFFATFLLALALGNAPPSPIELVSECFEIVHRSLWENNLPYDTWVILNPIVPHLSWANDWDKCERLRRGLIEAFVRNNWPVEALEHAIRDKDLLQRIRKSARRVNGWN